MPFVCNTAGNGIPWESKVKGSREGFIHINPENPMTGEFTGDYTINGIPIPIEGRCLADIMWFYLPRGTPTFIYWGEKKDDGTPLKKVKGHRLRLRESLFDTGRTDALVPDDWIAEKNF